ncbi:MAG TPA: RNA polymerase sigma factor region1.1 domain-containing protein [Roseomonas sp.]|nr:RNA polymerase sigma factor region1.1 domain-containing protein [Roseomonas sp.]
MPEEPSDPLTRRVQAMIALAKRRGYVTYDELNEAMPAEDVSVSQEMIDDLLVTLNELGIHVVERPPGE